MGKLRAYLYSNCGTCRKAKKYFGERQIDFEEIAIREQPPSLIELRQMLDAYQGDVRKLFNTSGQDYRQGGYKDKLNQLTPEQALSALAENGNLIKRPFVISDTVALVGFNTEQWDSYFVHND
ncbi:Spx/MgsR family RNA polymerase-binding regulatory protein [Sedimenticola selenatireducens]|uniref:Spx/MgsR family RNA polymerase-binding regulatory protein n=1 Tax=Sedimenticola selenatireducens TaxID=191960 RepID=A0A557RZH8_9GAMM|nr:Spx/MgsR family RNA polymerase-binding regulatory protein [Sedimenticola selenatireducens]TVO70554.1 Spx/MgsR family RNA polymerase-binding regulatory protein [Sedimenticola selenatireducens]TVT63131.1 MAG: Spx/MgsR family RNA polymerase-binding regulatory protein [Sedimenticola selenatireducens]